MADNNVILIEEKRRPLRSGNGGGGMSGDLEKRVERLEASMSEIRDDLVILKTRSENFCTRDDLRELATTIKTTEFEISNNFTAELASMRAAFTAELASMRAAFTDEQASMRIELYKAIDKQTKWMVMTIFGVLTVSVAIAKLFF